MGAEIMHFPLRKQDQDTEREQRLIPPKPKARDYAPQKIDRDILILLGLCVASAIVFCLTIWGFLAIARWAIHFVR